MENNIIIEENCDCIFCKQNLPFEFPEDLLEEFLNGDVVIFAGAGISSENKNVLRTTFYEDIEIELGYEDSGKSFPVLMEEYCQQANGRLKLLTQIKKRFSHIKSFPEMHRVATRFHRELATFYPIDMIITTNWDTYFENECGATPFVSSEDLSFWNTSGRRVLKIHGSINNLGSIIATTSDYKRCRKSLSTGVLGSILKQILATKTVVYIGYSFSDEDFLSINSFVKREMKGLNKQGYIISPIRDDDNYFRKNGLIPIYTDGTYFIEQIKKHAANGDHFLDDSVYNRAEFMLDFVLLNHKVLYEIYNCYDNPEIVYSASYQDGLIHGFERALAHRNKGEYSHRCEIERVLKPYDRWRQEKLKDKRYEDVAYIDGYTNSLIYLLIEDDNLDELKMPMFYAFGHDKDLVSIEDYQSIIKDIPQLHKSAYRRARKIVKDLTEFGTDVVFHHMPWL